MARLRGALAAIVISASGFVIAPAGGATPASSYLDATFGNAGSSQLAAPMVDVPTSVTVIDTAVLPDGRTVLAGVSSGIPCQSGGWWVARYLADGMIDTTFGGGKGWVAVTPTGLSSCTPGPFAPLQLRSVAVQSTGKIILAGAPNLVMMRLNVDGSVDTAFTPTRRTLPGTNLPPQCLQDGDRSGGRIWDLNVTADDRIYAAGSLARMLQPPSQSCPSACARARPWSATRPTGPRAHRAHGAVGHVDDRKGGRASHDAVGQHARCSHRHGAALAGLSPDHRRRRGHRRRAERRSDRSRRGRPGSCDSGGGGRRLPASLAVRRYAATGAPDATFADGGAFVEDDLGRFVAMTLDGEDRVLLGGARDEEINDLRLVRLDAAGALDTAFGSGGVATHRPARSVIPANFALRRLAVDADGRILIVGGEQDGLAFGRLHDNGDADTSFGVEGFAWATSPVTRRGEQLNIIRAMAAAPDGATLAILGFDMVKSGTDGVVVAGFGTTAGSCRRLARASARSYPTSWGMSSSWGTTPRTAPVTSPRSSAATTRPAERPT